MIRIIIIPRPVTILFYEGDRIGFERVPVDGSSKMEDDLMESIEPYDFKDAVDFQTAYLAGYLADKYDVNAEESIGHANRSDQTEYRGCFSCHGKGIQRWWW